MTDPDTVVAAATFRRNDLLTTLLPLLVQQAALLSPAATVVIVDNDPDGMAKDVVAPWLSRGARYQHEPRPGIAAARNAALETARTSDLIVFIDDDEEPVGDWLRILVDHWLRWRCAGVAGPVETHFTSEPAPWVRECGHFDTRVTATGLELLGAPTSNLLLEIRSLHASGLVFDEAFGLTGGSDTMLTGALVAGGGVIRWCQEAVVREWIPADRATREWVLRRTRRTSNVWSRVWLRLATGRRKRVTERLSLTARSVYRAVAGALRSRSGRRRGDLRAEAAGELLSATAVGMLSGAWGRVVSEYRREP